MRYRLLRGVLVLGLILLGTSAVWGAPPVVFSRDGGIWRTDLQGKRAERLGEGYDAELSPRGDRVALTQCGQDGGRFLAVLDLKTRRLQRISGIPGNNSYGPRWSPDGKSLAFNLWQDREARWALAVISPQGGDLQILSESLSEDVYGPFWDRDGRSVYGHDLTSFFRFDRDGGLQEKISVVKVVGDRGISSGSRFSIGVDGRWLFDAQGGASEDGVLASLVGDAVGAAFVYTPATGEVRRISPPGLSVESACWIPGGGVLFSGFEKRDVRRTGNAITRITFRIFRLHSAEGVPRPMVQDAHAPSCAMD